MNRGDAPEEMGGERAAERVKSEMSQRRRGGTLPGRRMNSKRSEIKPSKSKTHFASGENGCADMDESDGGGSTKWETEKRTGEWILEGSDGWRIIGWTTDGERGGDESQNENDHLITLSLLKIPFPFAFSPIFCTFQCLPFATELPIHFVLFPPGFSQGIPSLYEAFGTTAKLYTSKAIDEKKKRKKERKGRGKGQKGGEKRRKRGLGEMKGKRREGKVRRRFLGVVQMDKEVGRRGKINLCPEGKRREFVTAAAEGFHRLWGREGCIMNEIGGMDRWLTGSGIKVLNERHGTFPGGNAGGRTDKWTDRRQAGGEGLIFVVLTNPSKRGGEREPPTFSFRLADSDGFVVSGDSNGKIQSPQNNQSTTNSERSTHLEERTEKVPRGQMERA
ncbi:hypothetical protein niasHT_000232 [Heterodera trifolii]|uniref:Uncharacterized protein n=1 Tax=Heterodera trifolii TaxID=157864 RepID=A0ABD2LVK6_9BILA